MDQMDFVRENMNIDFIINPDLAITTEIYKYLVEKYTLANGAFSSGKASLLEFKASKMPELVDINIKNVSSKLPEMLVVVSQAKAYEIIRSLNVELKEKGFYVFGKSAKKAARLSRKKVRKGYIEPNGKAK